MAGVLMIALMPILFHTIRWQWHGYGQKLYAICFRSGPSWMQWYECQQIGTRNDLRQSWEGWNAQGNSALDSLVCQSGFDNPITSRRSIYCNVCFLEELFARQVPLYSRMILSRNADEPSFEKNLLIDSFLHW